MPLIYVHRGSPAYQTFSVGTQYIESGATLTLGNPTNVDMSSASFNQPGVYVIFAIDPGATFTNPTTEVQKIDVVGVPSGRTVVQRGGYDAYWDAATSTVRVQLS